MDDDLSCVRTPFRTEDYSGSIILRNEASARTRKILSEPHRKNDRGNRSQDSDMPEKEARRKENVKIQRKLEAQPFVKRYTCGK